MAVHIKIMVNYTKPTREQKDVYKRQAFSTFTMADMLQDGIYKIIDAGKQGLETVKEFNDLKTDLAMATGEGKAYVNDLMKSYNDLGQELGSVTSEVASSADKMCIRDSFTTEERSLLTLH